MKLFEAEELKEAFVNKGQRSRRYHIGDFWELNFKEICDVLDCAPTAEAIPIEWIKKWYKNALSRSGFMGDEMVSIADMLEQWEAENG